MSFLSRRRSIFIRQVLLVVFCVTALLVVFTEKGRTQKTSSTATQPIFKKKVAPAISSRRALSTTTGRTLNKRRGTKYRVSQGALDQEPLNVEISNPAPVAAAEFTGDVRQLPQLKSVPDKVFREPRELDVPINENKQPLAGAPTQAAAPENIVPAAPVPTPAVTFKGLDHDTWGAGWPPDTVGDVSASHYVQAVNTSIGIFNKTGTLLAAFTFDGLFSAAGTGTACDNSNQGDPTVIFDRMGSHWIVSDFAFTGAGTTPPFYQCIAVSKGNNPVSSGWWFYAVRQDDVTHPWFGDYPKMGIWPDGLYLTLNMFDSTNTFKEVRAIALNRTDLESGVAVRSVIADLNTTTYFSLLPSNLRGPVPPNGRENILVTESQTLFAFHVFKFHVDYSGGGSTFTGPTNVSQTSYTVAPATATTPGNALDTLRERLMMQSQYRNIGGVESIWVNHTVRSGVSPAPVGIQWAQINVTGGTITTTPVQQQIYGNVGADGVHRWMGSLAVDNQGNMALGYSAANASVSPDIRYAGRLATDPLNTLPQTEVTMLPGITRGNQTGNCGGSACIRWGDYSAMTVDPSDDCTFWYTTEYYETSGLNWQTRIGSFKFPTCVSAPTAAPATVNGHVQASDGSPLAGVTLRLDGSQSATAITDSKGNYQFENVQTDGFYTVTPALANYHFSPGTRSFSVLGNMTAAVFTGEVDTSAPPQNAIDSAEFFVRQHYVDFLGREPDQAGFNFWSNEINSCGADLHCQEIKRINVSAAFFLSIEFQRTGGLVDGIYRATYDRAPLYAEFMPDTALVGRDVVVGRAGWEQQLITNRDAFLDAFVKRSQFQAAYGALNNEQFVDSLLSHTRITWSQNDRDAMVTGLNTGSLSRAAVLGQIAGDARFAQAKTNQTFVMMEYFGYLRRDPDAEGFQFWLNKLNQFNGNFVQAEMVKAFISSGEYRHRFGP